MRKSRILLLIVAAPLLLGAELPFGREDIREYVLGRLSEMAGRGLSVAGEMDIDLGWEPAVRLEGVRVANVEWGEAPHLLELEALEVTLDMRRLLQGEVRLPRLALIGPRLFLEVSEEGEPNWVLGGGDQTIVQSAAAPEGKPGNLPRIDRLEVKAGELAYLDHSAPSPEWVRGEIADAGGSLDADGVDFAASGTLGGELYTIVLRAAPLQDLRAGQDPNPVFLLATAGSARLMVDGTVVAPFELRGIDLALEAHGSGFDELPLVTGLPESPPFDLSARLTREAGPWHLSDLAAAIGRSNINGALVLDLTGERPRVAADFSAGTLALGELLDLVPEGDEEPEPGPPPVPEGAGIDLSGLQALDAELDFTADELLFQNLRLAEVQARLTLEDGVVTLAPLSAAAGGGRVSTSLRLEPEPLIARAELRFDNVDLQRALVELEQGDWRLGVLDGAVAVSLAPPRDAAAGAPLDPTALLRRLQIEEGRVTYREPDQGTDLALELRAGPGVSGPLVRGEGRFRGAPVTVDVSTDPPLNAIAAGTPLDLAGTVRVGRTIGRIDAAIADPADLSRLQISFDLTGDFQELAELVDAEIPELPELTLEGRLRRSGPLWTVAGLEAHLGDSDLSGAIAVDTAGERPQIGAEFRSDTLDLTTLLPGDEAPDAEEQTAGDEPLDVPDILTEVDARLIYQAERIITESATISDFAIDTRLADGRLRLGPLRLTWREPEQDTRLAVNLEPPEDTGVEGLTGVAEGRFRGRPIKADLRTDAWIDLTEEGPPGTWHVSVSPGETELTASGDLRDLLSPQTLDVGITAQGPSPALLSDIIGVPLPDTPPYDLSATLRRDSQRIIFEDLKGRIGDSDISGRAAVDPANVPPDLDIALSSDRLDYDDLTALLPDEPKGERDRLFSDEPLGLAEKAANFQGRLRYRARSVRAAEVPLDDLRVDAELRQGRFTLSPLEFGVGGGTVRLTLGMDTAAQPPKADLEGEISRVNLREVLAAFELADESVGTVAGQLKVWMRGESIAELAGSTDGGLFLLMTGGAFDMLLVEVAGLDAGEALFAAFSDDKVPIDCAYLNLQSRDGQVDIDTFAVDTRDTFFLGGGQVDLDRERIELVIEPRPKDASILTFSSPLRVEGSLTNPEVQVLSGELIGRVALAVGLAVVQPLAALIPLIEPGTGGESPYCGGLMEALKEAQK